MFFVNRRTKEGCCRKRILPILDPEIEQGLDMSPFWMCFGGGAAPRCERNLPQCGTNEKPRRWLRHARSGDGPEEK
jgi:hypothetical protein